MKEEEEEERGRRTSACCRVEKKRTGTRPPLEGYGGSWIGILGFEILENRLGRETRGKMETLELEANPIGERIYDIVGCR